MLEIIKSTYFRKEIFSFVTEKKKLKLLKHNKRTQKLFNIDLRNYILFKRKFIVCDKSDNAQEFDIFTGNLLFEGKYLKGERHGKGIEYSYFDGIKNSIYEEEYLIPEINKFNNFGKILFKGEDLNGERNGKGKEYDNSGAFIFEGEYLKGKKWNGNLKVYKLKNGKGFIREYYDSNLVFNGEYLNGERNGKGEEYDYGDKLIFEGEFLNGKKWNGKGYDIYELKNGKGYAKEYKYGKLSFEGEYLNRERNGKGKEYNQLGRLLFIGEYLNGKRHGKGKEYDYYTGELKFEGEYIYGCRIKGKEYFNYFDHNQKSEYFNPLIYKEQFFNKESLNVKDNNRIIFEGECLNNIRLNGK